MLGAAPDGSELMMLAMAAILGFAAGQMPWLHKALRRLGLRGKFLPPRFNHREQEALCAVLDEVRKQRDTARETLEALGQHAALAESADSLLTELAPKAQLTGASIASSQEGEAALARNMTALAETLTQTGTSLEEMVFSNNEVVGSIQTLSRAAEETAASINAMDESMEQVVNQANSSSAMSDKVSQDAEAGVTAIKQTVLGIDKIKFNNRLAAEVIERLNTCINEVSTVLGVIDDVAEQTNLLALNAAIIAAQAGDHGRGFAVVADEIKALAERTGLSTKEISGIILRIQEHSRRVTDVVTSGVHDVDAGMQLGHHAEDALQHVVNSAQRSVVMMRGIAQATVEHAKGAKKINVAMSQVTETMAQIYYATSEQARGSELVIGNISAMQKLLSEVQDLCTQDAQLHATFGDLCETLQQHIDAVTPFVAAHKNQSTAMLDIVGAHAHNEALVTHAQALSELASLRL